MNRKKMTEAEAEMWKVELLRRRIAHAPPELREAMLEDLGNLHGRGRAKVREAAEAAEEEEE
ncbi:MAG TPA: hypothetical protein VFT76_02000 [Actinomycetota bacterium]|nr:hypothetical protein [Actinomycetota bacterium]